MVHGIQPSNSAQPKIDAVRAYGGAITFCAPTAPACAAALATVRAQTGAAFVPPYDAANTILGQGTAMLELLAQVPPSPPLAAVVAPVGGGGLLAGTALAAEGTGVRVFGAEPAGADDCVRGLEEGRRREDVDPDTIADGLRTPVGVLNFPIIQEKVEMVITVTDEVRECLTGRGIRSTVVCAELSFVCLHVGNHRGHAPAVGAHEDRGRAQRRGVVRCGKERPVSGVGHRGARRRHHQRRKYRPLQALAVGQRAGELYIAEPRLDRGGGCWPPAKASMPLCRHYGTGICQYLCVRRCF